jgi:hypothetical protein
MSRFPCLQRLTLLGGLLFLVANTGLSAQDMEDPLEKVIPGLRDRAVVLNIIARIVETNEEESWNTVSSKVTIPGRPVSIRIIGENIVITAQFTPYMQENGRNVLLAQGQIWISDPDKGIRYQSTMQTIPLEYGEQLYFFPLGKVDSSNDTRIEIQLELNPYIAEAREPAGDVPAPDAAPKETEIPQ